MKMNKRDWRPRYIKLVPTEERLTDAAGLGTMVEVFDDSPLSKPFAECLPERKSPNSEGSYRLGLTQISSFLYGHENLDDLEEFRTDPALEVVMAGETVAPRTMGDFLRDFEASHIESLNEYLSKMAWSIRDNFKRALPEEYKPKAPHLSIDTTAHVQSGDKMEGLAINYKGQWCLDSQVIFDEMGLCYGFQLRSGNTKSGADAESLIEQAFRGRKFHEEKYLSGDAAYCNQDTIKICLRLGVKFTFTANDATTEWKSHIEEITNWESWVYSKKEIEKAKAPLPKIEVGWFNWQPSWAENLRFPIVVKRTWVEDKGPQGNLFGNGYWDYYGIVTNMSLFYHSAQFVVEHHNKRGNAENFIREEKYGYDLSHFPCLSLHANFAFGLLAMVAHNILRWVALIQRPEKPHFSKKLRRRFIFIAGKVVTHARQIVIKISKTAYEEVTRLKQAWRLQPCPAFGFS